MKYDYGDPNRGFSYEWNHFYLGLKKYVDAAHFFDFYCKYKELGQEGMQASLYEMIKADKPNITIFSLSTDQFTPQFICSLQALTKTLCFFHDDTWRKEHTVDWAPRFNAFTTTDPAGVRKYKRIGLDNAVYVPFGVNESLFCPKLNVQKDIDVSFIGAWHPYREWLISRLKAKDINVEVYGYRWPNGMLAEEKMVEVFQRSKISINMTNCPSWDVRYLLSSPRSILNRIRSSKIYEQIKGRHFEIPACGTLQLSYYVDGLEKVFELGEEIIIYQTPEEMVDKVIVYLEDQEELKRVTENGLKRVLDDHSYGHRFLDVFKLLGWD